MKAILLKYKWMVIPLILLAGLIIFNELRSSEYRFKPQEVHSILVRDNKESDNNGPVDYTTIQLEEKGLMVSKPGTESNFIQYGKDFEREIKTLSFQTGEKHILANQYAEAVSIEILLTAMGVENCIAVIKDGSEK